MLPFSSNMPPTRRTSYTAADKLEMLKYAKEHGNRAAARRFGVNECNIRSWRRSQSKIEAMPKAKRADRGLKASFPQVEDEVLKFINERRMAGIGVSTTDIRIRT